VKLNFGLRCVISSTRIIGAILFSQTTNAHQKLIYSDTILFDYLIIQGDMFLFSKKMQQLINIKHSSTIRVEVRSILIMLAASQCRCAVNTIYSNCLPMTATLLETYTG